MSVRNFQTASSVIWGCCRQKEKEKETQTRTFEFTFSWAITTMSTKLLSIFEVMNGPRYVTVLAIIIFFAFLVVVVFEFTIFSLVYCVYIFFGWCSVEWSGVLLRRKRMRQRSEWEGLIGQVKSVRTRKKPKDLCDRTTVKYKHEFINSNSKGSSVRKKNTYCRLKWDHSFGSGTSSEGPLHTTCITKCSFASGSTSPHWSLRSVTKVAFSMLVRPFPNACPFLVHGSWFREVLCL